MMGKREGTIEMKKEETNYSFLAKTLVFFIILLGGIFIFLLLLEGTLRVFTEQMLEHSQYDAVLDHKEIPNEEYHLFNSQLFIKEFSYIKRTNSRGYDDSEHSFSGNGTFRIVLIGDSFVACGAVPREKCILANLDLEIKNRKNKSFEIINLGVGSYSMDKYAIQFKQEALNYSPQIVVLFTFLGNDLNGDDKLFVVENDTLNQVSPKPQSAFLAFRRLFARHSYAYKFMVGLMSRIDFTRNILIHLGIFVPHDVDIFGISSISEYEKNIHISMRILQYVQELADQNKIQLLFVIIPPKEQVDKRKFDEYFSSRNMTPFLREDLPEIDIKNFTRVHNITTLDLLEYLKARNINNTFYYETDGHWNELGHAEAAKAVERKLEELKWI